MCGPGNSDRNCRTTTASRDLSDRCLLAFQRWQCEGESFVIDPMDAEKLNDLASRVYAPATEASRLAGAGAGLNDND